MTCERTLDRGQVQEKLKLLAEEITEDLSRLDRARDISSCFGGAGTPYYISSFDGSYFLTKHCDDIGVFSFIPGEEGPEQVHALHP